jgi:hypothetical protein
VPWRGLQKVRETKHSSILELFEDCLAATIVVLHTKSDSSLC